MARAYNESLIKRKGFSIYAVKGVTRDDIRHRPQEPGYGFHLFGDLLRGAEGADWRQLHAARAGQINDETRFVLEHFAVPVPRLMETVETQVRDIQIRRTKGVRRGLSIKRAWNLMQENDIYTVPVVSSKGVLEGLITVGDIAKSYMSVYDSHICPRPIPSTPTSWRPCRGPPSWGTPRRIFPRARSWWRRQIPTCWKTISRRATW